MGLKSDGTVVATGDNFDGQCNVSSWSGIGAVSAGYYHTVGLKTNGTAVATGWNDAGQCDVGAWTGITAVSAGSSHSVGLRSNGTAAATGYNADGRCNVRSWTVSRPYPLAPCTRWGSSPTAPSSGNGPHP